MTAGEMGMVVTWASAGVLVGFPVGAMFAARPADTFTTVAAVSFFAGAVATLSGMAGWTMAVAPPLLWASGAAVGAIAGLEAHGALSGR